MSAPYKTEDVKPFVQTLKEVMSAAVEQAMH